MTASRDVSPEAGARFSGTPGDGPVVMLNLLRFRRKANYAHAPDLEPEGGCTGEEAYRRYRIGLEPLLIASGGKVLFAGEVDGFVNGYASVAP